MIDGDAEDTSDSGPSRANDGRSAREASPLARRVHDLVNVVEDLGDEPSAGRVHELRTTIRRVETLLPAEDESRPERKLRKQLDRIRKRAGKVRDVDVHLKALRSVPRTIAPEARDEVREALRKARDKRQRRLARAVADERDRGLVKRLRRVIARAAGVLHDDAKAAAVVADVLGAFDRLVADAAPLGAANLHQLRIATKRLRYRVEPFMADTEAARVVAELKRVQDAIGAWHDWATLEERTVDVLGDAASPLVAAVRARTAVELAKATRATERVAGRLRKRAAARGDGLATTGVRKAQRAMTLAPVPARSAGTSA